MAQAKNNNATHWVLGGALILIGLFVIIALVMVRSQAQQSSTVTTSINNAAPTIVDATEKMCAGTLSTAQGAADCTHLSAGLTLTADNTTTITIVAEAQDTNGSGDIANAAGVFYYYSGAESEACTADNNNCYKKATLGDCTVYTGQSSGQAANNRWVGCEYAIEYYAQESATVNHWRPYMQVDDVAGSTGDNAGSEPIFDINKTVAGTFPTISFGPRALGSTSLSGNNVDLPNVNTGNVDADIQVALDQTTISCATGSIPVGNVEWNYDAGATAGDLAHGDAGNTALSTTATTMDMTICARKVDTDTNGATTGSANPVNPASISDQNCAGSTPADARFSYWNIAIPATGVLGACSETMTITYIESV